MNSEDKQQDVNIAVMSIRMKHIEESITDIKSMVNAIRNEQKSEHKEIWTEVESLKLFKTKVTAYATLGSLIGGGIVTIISKLISLYS